MRESYALTLTVPQRELLLVQAQILDAPITPALREALTPARVSDPPQRRYLTPDELGDYTELFAQAVRRYPPALAVAASALRQIQDYARHHSAIHDRLQAVAKIPILTTAPEVMAVPLTYTQRRELTRFLSQSILIHSESLDVASLTRLIPRVVALGRLLPNPYRLRAYPVRFARLDGLALGLVILALRNTADDAPFSTGQRGWQALFDQLLAESHRVDARVYATLSAVATAD